MHRNETYVWGWKATSLHLTVCFALVGDDSELSLVLLVAFIWFFVGNQYGADLLSQFILYSCNRIYQVG